MEECNDNTTSDKRIDENVISCGESHMEEETSSAHPTPIIVNTSTRISQEVKK